MEIINIGTKIKTNMSSKGNNAFGVEIIVNFNEITIFHKVPKNLKHNTSFHKFGYVITAGGIYIDKSKINKILKLDKKEHKDIFLILNAKEGQKLFRKEKLENL